MKKSSIDKKDQTRAKSVVQKKQIVVSKKLIGDIRQFIRETQAIVSSTFNAGLTMLYWRIGERVNTELLKGNRAGYGEEIIVSLSRQLVVEYGKSFSEKNLRRMIQFNDVFNDKEIVVSLIRQLSWTHFLALIPLKDNLQREFYAEMCRVERWSVRGLRKKIDSMLYERTALSKKPIKLAKAELAKIRTADTMSPQVVFRDPYLLDFLGLNDHYLEKDLEDAILREMELFLLELGSGFTFMARQKRIQIDGDDFYIDLLFYHRTLKRLIALELKLGDFKAEYKGQMELYLRWLDKHERQKGEHAPLGIVLCAGKKQEQIELLELDKSGIHVAEYITVLPPKEILRQKLHAAIQQSTMRIENRESSHEA